MITSLLQRIAAVSDRLAVDLQALLGQSEVTQKYGANPYVAVVTPYPFAWEPLPVSARQLQNTARDLLGQLAPLAYATLVIQPSSIRQAIEERLAFLQKVIDQERRVEYDSVEEISRRATEALTDIALLVEERCAGDVADTLIIPDTNALYAWPDLDQWSFSDCSQFTIVLVSTVMVEIDLHKDDHRKKMASRRAKAVKHVRQIKGYRERAERSGGRLADGVTLRSGRSRIQSWARSPDMSRAPGWLDRAQNDDCILATAIEISGVHPRSPVAILTRDVNFQNKCDLARMCLASEPSLA